MKGLPPFIGEPIDLRLEPRLSVSGGKLRFDGVGTAVHAATFLKRREMALDADLLRTKTELRRILVHELFHFVWWRLGNSRRSSWDTLLNNEFGVRARGELGWSSEWRKLELTPADLLDGTRKWREYRCESFCDSAAGYFVPRHPEFTLAKRFRLRRIAWFERLISEGPLSI